MKITLHTSPSPITIDSSKGMDLSIPVKRNGDTVNAYSIPAPCIEPLKIGDFIGSKADGGPVNCEDIHFNPHGNGTHTECYGHVSNPEKVYLYDCLKDFWFKAQVLDLEPKSLGEDKAFDRSMIEGKLEDGVKALIVRTIPNDLAKLKRHYAGTNPVYFLPEFMEYLVEQNVEHILTDLPSVDKEEDQGRLESHHAFWQYPHNTRKHCTISELLFIPDHVSAGVYAINLMIAGFDTDASPSKPILYPIV